MPPAWMFLKTKVRFRCDGLSHLFLIPIANALVSPARSTSPTLFAGGAYVPQLWLFRLAPILGAAIAGLISRWSMKHRAGRHERRHEAVLLRIKSATACL